VTTRSGRFGVRTAYTLSSAKNYANDDQIPFGSGPIDPNDLAREYGPAPNDQRHRVTLSGVAELGHGVRLSGVWTLASGVPMDILMPGGQTECRPCSAMLRTGFQEGDELNDYLRDLNASGGIDGQLLPLVSADARFNDTFDSLDLRLSKIFLVRGIRLEGLAEVFNLFDVSNILGTSTRNYSGFSNVLVRDSSEPGTPGYLTSSQFGKPVGTAGGVFGSGGPFALQLGARVSF
jgi:hypothetical protein